jgi:thiol-disulfide isomerase/thioredoxin
LRARAALMMTVIIATVAAGVLAVLLGWLLTRRSGTVREIRSAPGSDPDHPDTANLGLSRTGPTVVHFSAPWCGPCDRVRRVVGEVCADLGDVAHVEIDLDANPAAARRFSVLSLPTTLIFDVDGRQRYRASGIPKIADLRSALEPLLA